MAAARGFNAGPFDSHRRCLRAKAWRNDSDGSLRMTDFTDPDFTDPENSQLATLVVQQQFCFKSQTGVSWQPKK